MASQPDNVDHLFTLFPRLPVELRLQIWRDSCQPRVVEVRYDELTDRCLASGAEPPAVLHACREARAEVLDQIYTLPFGTKTQRASSSVAPIYFAPRLDVLYVPRCGTMGYGDWARNFAQIVPGAAELVRWLAVDHVAPEVRRPWETYNKFCLMGNFPHLREAYLVLAPTTGEEAERDRRVGRHIHFVDPRDDRNAIMKLMEDVRESFTYEIGQTPAVSLDPGDDDQDKTYEEERLEGEVGTAKFALVPKRKVSCSSAYPASSYVACI